MALPCGALTLDRQGKEEPEPPVPSGAIGEWHMTRPTLELSAQPGMPATVRLRYQGKQRLLFTGLERRGTWLRVTAAPARVRVLGWAPLRQLARQNVGEVAGVAGGMITDAMGAMHEAYQGDLYIGPARVQPGTRVYATPGRGAWATVRDGDMPRVIHVRGQAWVHIAGAQGLNGGWLEGHAYVPRAAVTLPPNAAYQAQPK